MADEYNLRKYINFQQQITSAIWNEDESVWIMRIKDLQTGLEVEDWCHFFINASGFLKYVDDMKSKTCADS